MLRYTQEPGVNHSQKHLPGPQNARQSRESSTYKQLPSREGSNDRSHPSATPSDIRSSLRSDNVTPNRDSSQGGGYASTHNPHHEVTQTSPSMMPKAFIDHLLPLVQQIANVRIKDSEDRTPNGAEVNSSVITLEFLAQFSQQLINLTNDLHRHHKENGTQRLPLGETQDIAANGIESRVPPEASNSMNGHDHPKIFEGSAHLPSPMGKELPKPIRGVRTPTPEYLEKRRRSSFASHLPRTPPSNHTRHDSSRRYSSSELRRTSRDFTQRDSWDHNEYRRHSSRGMRAYSDRRSISPHRRRAPYSSSPSKQDRRNSSPTRCHRRSSPLPHRQRSPWSPERRHRSSEKAKLDSISRRHIEPVINHVKDHFAQADRSGSMLLQDLLENYGGISSSQQGTKTLSGLKVPGLWFAFRGFQEMEMSSIEFEIDEQTALKWNIRNKCTSLGGDACFNNEARFQLSLELKCFSRDDVQMTLQNLGRDVRSHDLVKALSLLKNTWPPQGHLIISINAESQNRKFWFPDIFTQKDSIKLEEFVHKGINLVRFIHLSDLSGNIFVLLAKANGIENDDDDDDDDDDTRMNFLLPGKGGRIFQKAIPSVSKG